MLALATTRRNAWPVGKSASSNAPSAPRHLPTDRISVTGVVVALVGAAITTVVGRATGAGWLPAIGLAVLLGVGLYLWARDKDKGWGDLGEGIMVSVSVAIALMAVQRDADDRTREATERRERQIREADAARERRLSARTCNCRSPCRLTSAASRSPIGTSMASSWPARTSPVRICMVQTLSVPTSTGANFDGRTC